MNGRDDVPDYLVCDCTPTMRAAGRRCAGCDADDRNPPVPTECRLFVPPALPVTGTLRQCPGPGPYVDGNTGRMVIPAAQLDHVEPDPVHIARAAVDATTAELAAAWDAHMAPMRDAFADMARQWQDTAEAVLAALRDLAARHPEMFDDPGPADPAQHALWAQRRRAARATLADELLNVAPPVNAAHTPE